MKLSTELIRVNCNVIPQNLHNEFTANLLETISKKYTNTFYESRTFVTAVNKIVSIGDQMTDPISGYIKVNLTAEIMTALVEIGDMLPCVIENIMSVGTILKSNYGFVLLANRLFPKDYKFGNHEGSMTLIIPGMNPLKIGDTIEVNIVAVFIGQQFPYMGQIIT